jgi:hypothetical protein
MQIKISNNRLVWCLYKIKCQTIDCFVFIQIKIMKQKIGLVFIQINMSNNRLVWFLYRLKCQTTDWFGVYTD